PHDFRHGNLNPARLPIPPRPHRASVRREPPGGAAYITPPSIDTIKIGHMGALRHMFVAMRISPLPGLKVSRRRLLVAGGLAAAAMALTTRVPAQAPADSVRILRAGRSRVPLPGAPGEAHARAGYDGAAAGPLLRVRRDETLAVRLINDLTEPTAVHWHGVRLPNAMDGVPGLTQAPIAPGASFDYRFIPPDAGTFWYHAPTSGSGSEPNGLAGVLIVDEPQPVDVD